MSVCDIKNCRREIGTLNAGPSIHYGNSSVCCECHKKLEEVRVDLPLAIMEFHAWALSPDGDAHARGVAADRVARLRSLQEWLKL